MMAETKTQRQYGLWDSPIAPSSVAHKGSFSDVLFDHDGTLVWRETRAGKGFVVLEGKGGDAPRDLTREFNSRGWLNYGGGAFTVRYGMVYFVDAKSGRLYRQALTAGLPEALTPAFGGAAAPTVSPDGHWLLYVHTYEDSDCLAVVDTAGGSWPQKLVWGNDFFMYPTWHPGGDRIAWIAWDHPNMPWDGTTLRIAGLEYTPDGMPVAGEKVDVAGGNEISVVQPEFSPDGRYLAYVSDETGWWQLYLYDLKNKAKQQLTNVEADHGRPAWLQNFRTYGFSPDGKVIYYLRNQQGFSSLWQLDLATQTHRRLDVDENYTWLEQISVSPDGQQIACIATGSQTPHRVVVYDTVKSHTRVIRRSSPEEVPSTLYSKAEPIHWQGFDQGTVYGLYYPPQNPAFEGVGKPPLLVLIHGGPTSQRTAVFDPQVQFFTSRGYAVLQVNYRGSTGYGRVYRNMLRGNWGVYDVEDAVSGARHLADEGMVDRQRMVIMGGSAGGFTVLKALEDHPGFFKAGVNLYGVSNQFDFLIETHKFEKHYNDTLLGPYPEAAATYRERSPLFFVDQIEDPLAVFQGADDKVVPRKQSDEVVDSLRRRGIPHIYHVYEGEGHGFRKPENIEHFYTVLERFLRQHVLFT